MVGFCEGKTGVAHKSTCKENHGTPQEHTGALRSIEEHTGALRNRLIDEKLGGSGLPQVAALGKYVSSTTSLGIGSIV